LRLGAGCPQSPCRQSIAQGDKIPFLGTTTSSTYDVFVGAFISIVKVKILERLMHFGEVWFVLGICKKKTL